MPGTEESRPCCKFVFHFMMRGKKSQWLSLNCYLQHLNKKAPSQTVPPPEELVSMFFK